MKPAKFFTLMLAPALARSSRSLNGSGAVRTFLSKGSLIGLALCLASSVGQAAALAHEKIVLRSGTVGGVPGSIPTEGKFGPVDDNITYLTNASCCSQLRNVAFIAADFDAARTGPAAELVIPHPLLGWIQFLPSDPKARWINWNHGNFFSNTGSGRPAASVLYAYDFDVTTTDITAASIDFHWAVDDRLGDRDGGANVVGVYVNGIPLSLDFRGPGSRAANSASQSGIEALLNPGTVNTLYVYQRDVGASVSGIIFSATINICCEQLELEKELLEGPEQIGIYLPQPTQYVFEIAYSNPDPSVPVRVTDTVPAEFEILDLDATAGSASFFDTSQGQGNSANRIEWDLPVGTTCAFLTVTVQTVESPGGGHPVPVFKPTSCGPLPINDGATAFEVDPETGEILQVEVVDPDTGEVTLESVVVVGPSNSLVVEAVEGAKPCVEAEEEEEEEEEEEDDD